MIIGITGSIASGKSTVSRYFQEKGYGVLDADVVAKTILEQREVQEELSSHFGAKILDEKGSLDRRRLREIVFQEEEERQYLNKVLHPRVRKVFEKQREQVRDEEIYFFDIPLLLEAKFEDLCDKILLVSAQENLQVERIMKRDGSTEELARAILSSQMPDREKRAKADYILENNQSLEKLYEKIKEVEGRIHEDCSTSRESRKA